MDEEEGKKRQNEIQKCAWLKLNHGGGGQLSFN